MTHNQGCNYHNNQAQFNSHWALKSVFSQRGINSVLILYLLILCKAAHHSRVHDAVEQHGERVDGKAPVRLVLVYHRQNLLIGGLHGLYGVLQRRQGGLDREWQEEQSEGGEGREKIRRKETAEERDGFQKMWEIYNKKHWNTTPEATVQSKHTRVNHWVRTQLHTYMFHVSSLKPAQDPWQLIHSGEGCAFDPHGLNTGMKGSKKHSW